MVSKTFVQILLVVCILFSYLSLSNDTKPLSPLNHGFDLFTHWWEFTNWGNVFIITDKVSVCQFIGQEESIYRKKTLPLNRHTKFLNWKTFFPSKLRNKYVQIIATENKTIWFFLEDFSKKTNKWFWHNLKNKYQKST